MFCETSSFYCTVHKMFFFPLFFFTAYGFSFHYRGERLWSEDSVGARVGWALPNVSLDVFLFFSPLLTFISPHSLPDLFCSFHLLHCQSFLSLLDLLLNSSSSFSPFLNVFLHIFLLPLPLSLPQRSHGSLVVCLLEGIPTPPPPPLEPCSFLPLLALFSSLSLSFALPFLFFLHLFLMWKF